MFRWILIAVFLWSPVTLSVALPRSSQVTIVTPVDGAQLPGRPCLSGTTSEPNAKLVAVIHPTEVSDYYVQGDITLRGNSYKVTLYLGDPAPGRHQGKHFEIRILAEPKDDLREGMRLASWPKSVSSSPTIEVVRNDNASDGCGVGSFSLVADAPENRAAAETPLHSEPSVPAAAAYRWARLRSLGESVVVIAMFLIVPLFAVLVTLPEYADAAIRRLTLWLVAFQNGLVEIALAFKASTTRLADSLFRSCSSWAGTVWGGKGFTGTLRQFSSLLLATPLLHAALILAFYSEASIIVVGLNSVFGIESRQANNSSDFSTLMNSQEDPRAEARSRDAKSKSDSGLWRGLADYIVKAFRDLWVGEKLGFLAISLACLQAAFGVVLLWRMGGDQTLRVRPLALLRDRPIPTACFLLLNIGLSILAANRGFEISVDGVNWVMASVISGAIALVMPWILALTQHFAIECTSDCLGVAKAVAVIAALFTGLLVVISAWALTLLFVLASVAAAFATFFIFYVMAGALLLAARMTGDFVQRLRSLAFFEVHRATGRVIPATVGLLILAGGFYLIRGLVQ